MVSAHQFVALLDVIIVILFASLVVPPDSDKFSVNVSFAGGLPEKNVLLVANDNEKNAWYWDQSKGEWAALSNDLKVKSTNRPSSIYVPCKDVRVCYQAFSASPIDKPFLNTVIFGGVAGDVRFLHKGECEKTGHCDGLEVLIYPDGRVRLLGDENT